MLTDVASQPVQLLKVFPPADVGAVRVTDVPLLKVRVNWLDPAPWLLLSLGLTPTFTPLAGFVVAIVSTEVWPPPPPIVTVPLALLPSEKFTLSVNTDPGVNSPLGKLPFTKSAAKSFKLPPAVSGMLTELLAAFSNGLSSVLAAPSTQN